VLQADIGDYIMPWRKASVLFCVLLILVGCSPVNNQPEAELTSLEEWDVVVIGDSTLWGIGENIAEHIESDYGISVNLHDFSIPNLTAAQALEAVKNSEPDSANAKMFGWAEIIQEAEYIFIAVGTPPGEDGSADLKYVLGVATEIGQSLQHYSVIIDKSTVPVGTAAKVKAAIDEALAERGVDRVLCLEFNQRLAATPAPAFIEELLVRRLGVRYLLVGDDFRFGHRRQGDFRLLCQAGQLLGFAGIDGRGLEGVEFFYEKYLQAESREIQVSKDALGRGFDGNTQASVQEKWCTKSN
jgi:hypothetical protein